MADKEQSPKCEKEVKQSVEAKNAEEKESSPKSSPSKIETWENPFLSHWHINCSVTVALTHSGWGDTFQQSNLGQLSGRTCFMGLTSTWLGFIRSNIAKTIKSLMKLERVKLETIKNSRYLRFSCVFLKGASPRHFYWGGCPLAPPVSCVG